MSDRYEALRNQNRIAEGDRRTLDRVNALHAEVMELRARIERLETPRIVPDHSRHTDAGVV